MKYKKSMIYYYYTILIITIIIIIRKKNSINAYQKSVDILDDMKKNFTLLQNTNKTLNIKVILFLYKYYLLFIVYSFYYIIVIYYYQYYITINM
jgi:hypothetical protein